MKLNSILWVMLIFKQMDDKDIVLFLLNYLLWLYEGKHTYDDNILNFQGLGLGVVLAFIIYFEEKISKREFFLIFMRT